MMKKRFAIQLLCMLAIVSWLPVWSAMGMTGRVEGNKIYYSAEKTYEIGQEFIYIGSFASSITKKANNKLAMQPDFITNEVFGKRYNNTNELTELFIAQYEVLPNEWRVATPGPMNEKLYNFKPTRFSGLAEFLAEKGYTFSNNSFGGLLLGNGYIGTYTKFYFVVSNTSLPSGKDKRDFLRAKFMESIKEAKQ